MKNDDDNDVSDNESKDSSGTDIPVDYSTKESIVDYLQQLKDNHDAPFKFVKKIDLDLLRKLWGWQNRPNMSFATKDTLEHHVLLEKVPIGMINSYNKGGSQTNVAWVELFCKFLNKIKDTWTDTISMKNITNDTKGTVVIYHMGWHSDHLETLKRHRNSPSRKSKVQQGK